MNDSQGKFPNLLSPNIIGQIFKVLTDLAETVLWGKASKQTILAVKDVQNWFREMPPHYKKKTMLAAVLKIETSTGIRIYQGAFDKKLNCFLARQLIVDELSQDLSNLFANEELLIFIEDPKLLASYAPLGE